MLISLCQEVVVNEAIIPEYGATMKTSNKQFLTAVVCEPYAVRVPHQDWSLAQKVAVEHALKVVHETRSAL